MLDKLKNLFKRKHWFYVHYFFASPTYGYTIGACQLYVESNKLFFKLETDHLQLIREYICTLDAPQKDGKKPEEIIINHFYPIRKSK